MKNFNFLAALIAVSVMILGVYSCGKEEKTKIIEPADSQSSGFGQTCLQASACSPYEPTIINNVTLPAYPGCVFRVEVSICVQQAPGIGTEIFVGNYKLLDASNCPALWNEWSNLVLDPLSQPGEINDFINNMDLQVYSRLEDYLYAEHGNIVGCNSPLGTLTISFIKATCNTMCSYIYLDNPFPDDTGGDYILNDVVEGRSNSKYGLLARTNCDTEGCCQRRTNICYNPVTNQVEKTTSTYPTSGLTPPSVVCAGGAIDEPDLPQGAVLSDCLPCSFRCQ